jgi:hypothetical protein
MHNFTNFSLVKKVSDYIFFFFILLIVFFGVLTNVGLYADGSHYLVQVLFGRSVTDWDHGRQFAHFINQIPIVLALKIGVTNLAWLIKIHSMPLVIIPNLFWILSLLLMRQDRHFFIYIWCYAFTFLTSGFFFASEYSTVYAVCAFLFALFHTKKTSLKYLLVAFGCSVYLLRAYESMIFLGPIIFYSMICVARLTNSSFRKVLVYTSAFLIASSSGIAYMGIIFPRDPNALLKAENVFLVIKTFHFQYMLVGFIFCIFAFLKKNVDSYYLMGISVFFCILYFFFSKYWNPPYMHCPFRIVSGLFLAGSFLIIIASDKLCGVTGNELYEKLEIAAKVIILPLMMTFIFNIYGFYKYKEGFADEIPQTEAITAEKTSNRLDLSIYHSHAYDTTLSIVLRGEKRGLIIEPTGYNDWKAIERIENFDFSPMSNYVTK